MSRQLDGGATFAWAAGLGGGTGSGTSGRCHGVAHPAQYPFQDFTLALIALHFQLAVAARNQDFLNVAACRTAEFINGHGISLRLLEKSLFVIPAKAGIHVFQELLDPGWSLPRTSIRGRGDGFAEFCRMLPY